MAEGLRRWDLRWRRGLYQRGEGILCELRRLLENVGLKDNDEEDKWIWMDGSTNFYSVSSSYKVLMSGSSNMANAKYARALHKTIPSNVFLLAWRLFENKVATKGNICKRGVDQNMIHCVVGCGGEESVAHLFS